MAESVENLQPKKKLRKKKERVESAEIAIGASFGLVTAGVIGRGKQVAKPVIMATEDNQRTDLQGGEPIVNTAR